MYLCIYLCVWRWGGTPRARARVLTNCLSCEGLRWVLGLDLESGSVAPHLCALWGLNSGRDHERAQAPREAPVRGVRDRYAFDAPLVPFTHGAGFAAADAAYSNDCVCILTNIVMWCCDDVLINVVSFRVRCNLFVLQTDTVELVVSMLYGLYRKLLLYWCAGVLLNLARTK